jgi:hypothetical protein
VTMRRQRHATFLGLLGVLCRLAVPSCVACSEPTVLVGSNTVPPSCAVAPAAPKANLGLDSFYEKYLDGAGIPVVASAKVSDEALRQACVITAHVVRRRDDVRLSMINKNLRVAVLGVNEVTMDIPEYSDLPATAGRNWNQERGEGATEARPVASVGEENLLCLATDLQAGESILVDVLAYAIDDFGLSIVDADFDTRLSAAYQAATSAGLWQNTMAGQRSAYYFAEGVQDWYDANNQASPPDGVNNEINTRAELEAYDPALAQIISENFAIDDWRPRCPR